MSLNANQVNTSSLPHRQDTTTSIHASPLRHHHLSYTSTVVLRHRHCPAYRPLRCHCRHRGCRHLAIHRDQPLHLHCTFMSFNIPIVQHTDYHTALRSSATSHASTLPSLYIRLASHLPSLSINWIPKTSKSKMEVVGQDNTRMGG